MSAQDVWIVVAWVIGGFVGFLLVTGTVAYVLGMFWSWLAYCFNAGRKDHHLLS